MDNSEQLCLYHVRVNLLPYLQDSDLPTICFASRGLMEVFYPILKQKMLHCISRIKYQYSPIANKLGELALQERRNRKTEDIIMSESCSEQCLIHRNRYHTLNVKLLNSCFCSTSYEWYLDGVRMGYSYW